MSLANAHVSLEAEAISPKVENTMAAISAATMALVARYDWVALKKISMMGNPVGVVSAAVTSPMLKRMARLNPKQSVPLMTMLQTMPRGTTTAALVTSSPGLGWSARFL